MSFHPDLSTNKFGDFLVMCQGEHDYSTLAFRIDGNPEYGTMLCIGAQEGAIYVTREQAKAFFGLVEPNEK